MPRGEDDEDDDDSTVEEGREMRRTGNGPGDSFGQRWLELASSGRRRRQTEIKPQGVDE